ncbi:ERF family protein [Planomicrobium chinense]|uniref:ERF family protein n=1 Tax=Planococcus chinensis TaxID=272917 RepID=UPI001CC51CB9|nr:ERF family protein [Planococcus chinensis]MBZ5203229.1 ERF family protein [Planococcus chinensis]
MKKSESITEIAKALSAFQGEVKQPMKDKDNPFFKSKYVPLENVVEAITEISAKHGLSFIQSPTNSEDKVGVTTLLMHSSGEWIESEPIYAKPAKTDAQATGSVITYLKRYSLAAVFGITSDEDDDGNAASEPKGKKDETTAPNENTISAAQIKALGAKVGNIAKATGQDQAAVYASACKHFSINKATKDLTKAEASKVIDYLAKLEG